MSSETQSETQHEPLRVLIAAENASRTMGGEAILPFHYFRLLLARNADVHLITHERCRAELLALFPDDTGRLHFVTDHPLQKLLFSLGKLVPRRLSEATFGLTTQLLTQQSQRAILRTLITPRSVIHQPIPVAPRFPSLLNSLGTPLVIGPLNGGMEFPLAFRSFESHSTRLLIALARTLTNLANLFFRGKREAAALLVANDRTRQALPSGTRGQILQLPENAVDTAHWPPASVPPASPARFLFMGRLIDWKALDIVLEAMAAMPPGGKDFVLDIVGDGPMRIVWQAQAERLDLTNRVHFHGWQSQAVCAKLLQACTALVLPSLYESGGAVVLEAMAVGRPVIATAWGGPTDYLDTTTGILVDPTSREALVTGFADSMQSLANSPRLCQQLGKEGRARVLADFEWDRKLDRMLEIYNSVLQQR